MNWNRTLTAEEIALIVLDLDHFNSIDDIPEDQHEVEARAIRDPDYIPFIPEDKKPSILEVEARKICDALLREIIQIHNHADGIDELVIKTHLIIADYTESIDDYYTNHELTTVTRESAAKWFLFAGAGDRKKAERLVTSEILKDIETNIETDSISLTSQNNSKDSSEYIARTPESSLIDSLGIMAILLAKKQASLSNGNKPNASQIVIAIERAAAEHGYPVEQISNLERDITKAVKKVLGETG
jgi:hypothetical protein